MSTHKNEFLKRHNITKPSLSIREIAQISNVSYKDLQEIYNRGIGAYKTNPTSVRLKGTYKKNVKAPLSKKLSKEQWGLARVYAFVNKLDRIRDGKQKTMNQDCDIGRKYYKNFKCNVK